MTYELNLNVCHEIDALFEMSCTHQCCLSGNKFPGNVREYTVEPRYKDHPRDFIKVVAIEKLPPSLF